MADVPENPDSGAAGTEYQTIEALRMLGHEVDTIWTDDLSHRIRHGNLHYLLELPFSYRNVMLKRLQKKEYDVIHVNQPHGYLAAKSLHSLKMKAVFIHRSHGFELRVKNDLKPWIKLYKKDKRPILRKAFSKILDVMLLYNSRAITYYADGHIVSASQCCDFLQKAMGVPLEQIAVIPQAPPEVFLRTSTLDMTHDRLRNILYIGQFAFIKAPVIVAEVMNRLANLTANICFTWICSKKHHREVEQLLSPITLKRIRLLDWMSQNELLKVYDEHGVFLFPSFFEGFGKVFLEGTARGVCVVAADNGGAHDVIKSGENGILVPTGDIEAMVGAYFNLLNTPDLAIQISSNALATAREYTWERVAKETVAFYCERLKDKFGLGY